MTRLTLIGVGMLSVAALAFAGGRISKNSPGLPQNAGARPVGSFPPQESAQPPELPADVRDLAGMSFPQTFEMLKATPPEVLKAWAKNLQEITPSPTRQAAITTLFRTLIHVNPPAAKAMILELDEDSRWLAMMAIKDAAPPRAMKEVAEILMTYDRSRISGCSYDLLRSALDEWSRNDPVAVRQFMEERGEMEGYFGGLVRNWSAYDPESARTWVTQQFESRPPLLKWEEGETRSMEESTWGYASEGMIQGWMEGFLEKDREAALNYILANDDDEMAKALPSAVGDLFLESPEEARAFVLRLPEKRRAEALSGVTDKADRSVYEDEEGRIRSPEFVANWLMQFPSEVWSKSITAVLLDWKIRSAPELFSWMDQLPAETQRIVLAQYDCPLFTADSVEQDFNRVMEVPNPVLRNQLLERLMQQAGYSRAAVLASLESTQLSEAEKARLAGLIPPDEPTVETPSEEEDEE